MAKNTKVEPESQGSTTQRNPWEIPPPPPGENGEVPPPPAENTEIPPPPTKEEDASQLTLVEDELLQVEDEVTEAEPVQGELVEMVIAVVPKAFRLRLNNFQIVDIKAGTQKMERAWAEHWYSVANGVTIFDDEE